MFTNTEYVKAKGQQSDYDRVAFQLLTIDQRGRFSFTGNRFNDLFLHLVADNAFSFHTFHDAKRVASHLLTHGMLRLKAEFLLRIAAGEEYSEVLRTLNISKRTAMRFRKTTPPAYVELIEDWASQSASSARSDRVEPAN